MFAFEIIKLVGREFVDKFIGLILAHDHGRKEDGMKRDVIFADEIDEFGLWIKPIIFPSFGFTYFFGPFARCRDIADRRVEPDVENLALGLWKRNRNAPIGIAGNGARAQFFDIGFGEV